MTLTDPRQALAEQSSFIGYLMGLAGAAHVVSALAEGPPARTSSAADDFVYGLLGLASLGRGIEHLAAPAIAPAGVAPHTPAEIRWLR
ncbi:hypothetical protein AU196_18590 [Mycobacterium sp. IS-1742]|uniref:hypothetical protein n=1 Tax=Mycobacterium sp. IS-1742 TaxID=1772285 RepID=UPI00073FDB24|nr:hypothetical protein [Mycobacterium sp. IS-1742]KUI31325.1 hypothetical protein AU196_18590 [Mycobacterium sp. IS-1742]